MPVTAPSLAVTPDYVAGSVSIDVSAFGSATSWTLYRIAPEGYAQTPVRGVIGQSLTVHAVVDVDFPQGTDVQYLAVVTDGTSSASTLSDWLVAPDLGRDALCPLDATASAFGVTVLSMDAAAWGQRAETVTVVGRADPVVVTDRSVLPTFSLEVLLDSLYVRALLNAAMDDSPVMLFSPRYPSWAFGDGEPIYLAVTGREESQYGEPSDGARIVRLACQQVGVPKVPTCVTAPSPGWVL